MGKIVDKFKDTVANLDKCATTDTQAGVHFTKWGAEQCERDNAKES